MYLWNLVSSLSQAYQLILMSITVTLLWEAHVAEATFVRPRAHVLPRVIHGIRNFSKLMQAHLALEQLVGPLRLRVEKLFCAPEFFSLFDAICRHRVPCCGNSLVISTMLHRFVLNFTWLHRLCFWKRWVSTCGCLCAGSAAFHDLLRLSYLYRLQDSVRNLFGRLNLHWLCTVVPARFRLASRVFVLRWQLLIHGLFLRTFLLDAILSLRNFFTWSRLLMMHWGLQLAEYGHSS